MSDFNPEDFIQGWRETEGLSGDDKRDIRKVVTAAYIDGLRRGAEIARAKQSPPADAGWNLACDQIAAAIEAEIKDTP